MSIVDELNMLEDDRLVAADIRAHLCSFLHHNNLLIFQSLTAGSAWRWGCLPLIKQLNLSQILRNIALVWFLDLAVKVGVFFYIGKFMNGSICH